MSLMTNWLVHNDFENCFIILISLILILDCVEVTKVCWIVLKCVKSVAKFKSVVTVTGEFPAKIASNAENVSIWWRHHDLVINQHMRHRTTSSSLV